MAQKYRRLMVDLETMGTRPGCAVISIGAAFFSEEGQWKGPTFYEAVHLEESKSMGLHVDPSTERWWASQGEKAQRVLTECAAAKPVKTTLTRFCDWVAKSRDPDRGVELWGNGADFDNPILAACFHAAGHKWPFGPMQGRCYRTLKNLFPQEKLVRQGTHHNALDDALSQAEHAARILKRLRTAGVLA